jgi:endo-1,4-beta-xylanase
MPHRDHVPGRFHARRPLLRRLAVPLAIVAIVLSAIPATAATALGPSSLRDASRYLRIGSAVGLPQLFDDQAYADTLAREFDSVTPENAMKWESVEPQRGVNTFGPADSIVDFARAHDQLVRGHTLVWHNQLPSWLTSGVSGGTISPTELRDILRQHIFTEAGHFKGQVYAWDVVNEAVNDDAAGSLRNTIWLQNLGAGYIADALRWAHQADPHAKLYLNDYNIEWIGPKSDAYYNLAKELLAEGVPLDGIGIQGHLDIQYGFPDSLAANIKRFTDLGLEVSITELDVRVFTTGVSPEDFAAELTKQADYYRQVVDACLTQRQCVSITVWGFSDKYSWVPGFFTGEGAACLLDESFQPKPAYDAVLASLQARGKPGG